MAEEARRSRCRVRSEATDSATTLVPQLVAPQPVRANHPDSIAARSKSPTRRSGLPGGAPVSSLPPMIPPPSTTPSVTEQPRNESVTSRPPIPPSPPEPANNAYPVGNALPNLGRKLVSHMPSSSELVRSSPSPQAPQYARVASGTSFPLILFWQEHATCDASE